METLEGQLLIDMRKIILGNGCNPKLWLEKIIRMREEYKTMIKESPELYKQEIAELWERAVASAEKTVSVAVELIGDFTIDDVE